MTIRKQRRGTGHVSYHKGSKRWRYSYLVEGKRKEGYAPTRKEAETALSKALVLVAENKLSARDMAFGDWFMEWMDLRVKSGRLSEKTLVNDNWAKGHVVPLIGKKKLSKITVQTIENMYDELKDSGLAPSSVHKIHALLNVCWKRAVRRGLVTTNIIELSEHPSANKRDPYVLSRAEWADLKDASYKHPEGLLVELLMYTGLRVDKEALSLKWDDIDLGKKRLTVVDSKTSAGERIVGLTGSLCERLASLKFEHESIQANPEHLNITLKTGKQVWNPGGLVFVTANGKRCSLSNIRKRMYLRVKAIAQVPSSLTFHDLRHNFGSYLLSEGVPITTVSKMMGHGDPSITMRVYAHALEEDQSLALEALNKLAIAN